MRCAVVTIERHLLALAGNRRLLAAAVHPGRIVQIKAFLRRNSQSKLLLLQFFCLLVVAHQSERANKSPSDATAAPCSATRPLPAFLPLLIYSNDDAWRCLFLLFICIFFGFLLALSLSLSWLLFCCINRS